MDDLRAIVKRFAEADCSWLNTVRPSGSGKPEATSPHTAPIWHVWYAGRVYVVTMATAVKTRNIRANPAVTITHPDPLNVIIIEGQAREVEGMVEVLRSYFQQKYNWDIAADDEYRTVIEIRPTRLIAWGHEGAAFRTRWSGEEVANCEY